MKPRSSLSETLHSLCDNVYFQPPESYKLKYPCIIYEFNGVEKRLADNGTYTMYGVYSMLYITRDPDSETKLQLAALPMCSMNNTYERDNLYHYSYRIYH